MLKRVLMVFDLFFYSHIIDDRKYWLYAIILLCVPILTATLDCTCMMMLVRVAVSMKSMASEAIYRKALVLTSSAKGTTSTGQLVNIMSSDAATVRSIVLIIIHSYKLLLW